MKTDFEILEEYFGNQRKVAGALGITDRHYRNVKKGKAGKFLNMRIKFMIAEIVSKIDHRNNHSVSSSV